MHWHQQKNKVCEINKHQKKNQISIIPAVLRQSVLRVVEPNSTAWRLANTAPKKTSQRWREVSDTESIWPARQSNPAPIARALQSS